MITDIPPFPDPGAGDPILLRPLPPGWVAPPFKEIPLLTLGNVLRNLQDAIEEAGNIADRIDFAALEREAMEGQEAKRRWESDHPGVPYGTDCSCPCDLWLHKGLCKEYAELVIETPVVIHNYGFPPLKTYVCRPCRIATSTDKV